MARRVIFSTCLLLAVACRDGAGPRALPVSRISDGVNGACALTTGGAAYCWGDNRFGELGIGSTTGPALCAGKYACSTRPVPVSGGLALADVSVGGNPFACGVTTTGRAYCWGANWDGALGTGDTVSRAAPTMVSTGLSFALVRAGVRHVCGLTTSGSAYCWSNNHRGSLGNGDTVNSYIPVAVAGGLTFVSLSVGLDDACGVTADGTAYCWGNGGVGQLGNGTYTNSWVPTPVAGALRFSVVSTGLLHTCGVTVSGAAYCWGANYAGELGTGDTSISNTPERVVGGLTFANISASWWYTCGLTTSGAAYCWGWDAYGQGGLGGYGYSTPVPTAVLGELHFTSVSAGGYNTCGVTLDGAAYCWGQNGRGELGDGSTQFAPFPQRVVGP